MKKIATLTFHNTTNYGAILQTYALQRAIEKLGYDTEVIDYQCEAVNNRYKIIKISDVKNAKELLKIILGNRNKKKLKEKFDSFTNKYIKISDKKYTKETIHNSNSIYNKFVVGSDQVWNLSLSGNDFTYFLDFVTDNNKKYSYAASFGSQDISDNYKDTIAKTINEFYGICVREEQGKEIVKRITNREADITLDPTLLIKQKEWKEIMPNMIKNKKYILLYIIAPNNNIIKFAKEIAKKNKCEIIYINHSLKNVVGVKNIKCASPEEFLWYIENAEYIITTSFHGVAFSINFKKKFFYALSDERENYNSRIENLVNKLDLTNRNIKDYNQVNDDIDYIKVHNLLDIEKENSLNYLKEMLNNDNM